MQQELLVAVLAGLGGMFGWGLADFFAKKTIDKIGDITTLFWGQFMGTIPLLILFFFSSAPVPRFSIESWVYLLILGVWSGLSYLPVYVAFGKGKVSLLSPIFATYAAVVAILSALVFGEVIPMNRQLAILIVFIGVLLINGDPRDAWALFSRKGEGNKDNAIKGLPEILLAVGLYSLWLLGLNQFIGNLNWIPILLAIRIFSSITLFVYAKATDKKIEFADKSLWKYVFLIGLFDVAAFSFVSYGFSATSQVSIVVMLSSAFSLPVIVLGRLFLKERATLIQLIGSLVIVGGIILLSLF